MRMIKIISRSESAVLLLRTVTHSPQTLLTIMSLIFFARARVLRRGVRAWGRRRGAGREQASRPPYCTSTSTSTELVR